MTMTTDEPTTTSPTTTVDTSATEPTTDGPTTDATTTEPTTTDATTDVTTTETTTTTDPTDTTGETTSTTDPTDATTTDTTGPAVDPDCGLGDGPDFNIVNNGFSDYSIDGALDPGLTVVRGCSYTFTINALNHPFLIKTVAGNGAANTYNDGVTNNGEDVGEITWDVPLDAPDDLFYNCQVHLAMGGTITVIDG